MIFRRRRSVAPTRQGRVAALVQAARTTPFYGGLLRPDSGSGDGWLAKLPVLRVEQVYASRQDFEAPGQARCLSDFRYPIQPSPVVTSLVRGFRETSDLRMVTRWDESEVLDQLEGGALAAPVHVLRALAEPGRTLDFPLVAFTGVRHGWLTADDRDLCWHCFQVPVFEQWLGLANEVLAEECEAHNALHIRETEAIFEVVEGEVVVTSLGNLVQPVFRLATGVTATLVDGLCECGASGLRLTGVAPRAMAAGR